MTYLSAAKLAEKWGVTPRTVRSYCAQGKIPGAFLTGKTWNIPEDAKKPTRASKRKPEQGNAPEPTRADKHEPRSAESPLLKQLKEERTSGMKGGIYHKVQVALTYNSNRIEGSRLTEEQTRFIFETSTIIPDSEGTRVDDIIESVNHFRAIDFIIDNAAKPLSEPLIKEIHRILKSGTTDAAKDWFAVGDYKRLPNEAGGRTTTQPENVHKSMQNLLATYDPKKPHAFQDIVEFHVLFERIHAFQDGNGRVGRLIMFKECLNNGIVPFIITDDIKAFYYRGLAQWDSERGFLLDTCLTTQDAFKETLNYFRIPY